MYKCFIYIFLASLTASFSSLALSKMQNRGNTISGYLLFYFFTGFLISAFLNKLITLTIPFNLPMTILGSIVGVLIILLMVILGKTLQNGPTGLTFAFQNSGAIVAPILLALIFKKNFGFPLTIGNLIGMSFVLIGLFWAVRGVTKNKLQPTWVLFALLTFITQGLILSIFQWRCLLIQAGLPTHRLIPFSCPESADLWFMPALFFSAWVIQTSYFFFFERRVPTILELSTGSIGGIANGLSTFFLLRATAVASPSEKAMLFPLFTVLIILLCNVYGKLFYHEKISWKANALAVLGIFIGTTF